MVKLQSCHTFETERLWKMDKVKKLNQTCVIMESYGMKRGRGKVFFH